MSSTPIDASEEDFFRKNSNPSAEMEDVQLEHGAYRIIYLFFCLQKSKIIDLLLSGNLRAKSRSVQASRII